MYVQQRSKNGAARRVAEEKWGDGRRGKGDTSAVQTVNSTFTYAYECICVYGNI